MRIFSIVIVLLATILLNAGCAKVPYTERIQMVPLTDIGVTREGMQLTQAMLATTNIERGTPRAVRAEKIFQAIVRVADKPEIGWQFYITMSDAKEAYSLANGTIVMSTSFLDSLKLTDDELAVFIGHEAAHVIARHISERKLQKGVVQNLATMGAIAAGTSANSADVAVGTYRFLDRLAEAGFLRPYGRLHELEADKIGVILMAKAGYNPNAAVSVWKKMEKYNPGVKYSFMQTHPPHFEREEALRNFMPEALSYYKPTQRPDIMEMQQAAEQGVAQAQFILGLSHLTGDKFPKDSNKATEWLQKAAEQGHSMAQTILGGLYNTGEGVQQDVNQAAVWFQKAAEQGNPLAQVALGNKYSKGEGVQKDVRKATELRKKGCESLHKRGEQGDQSAMDYYNRLCVQ